VAILVCPLSRVQECADAWTPNRAISVLDPGHPTPEVGGLTPTHHLRLTFHDAHVAQPGVVLPGRSHLVQLLTFIERCAPDDRLLIHCRAGIGRSTATAFVVACQQFPAVAELDIARALRQVAPLARPNETLVRIADDVMARGGRMTHAIAETGRGLPWIEVSEGEPFELDIPTARVASELGR
jgi:predicted protein tyrosine phosphatase